MNIGAAIAHLVLGIVLSAWYFTSDRKGDDVIKTATYVLGPTGESTRITPSYENTMIILLLVVVFFTSAIHVIYATRTKWYNGMIEDKNNYVRWIEYAISATILIVAIAFSSGMSDFDAIILCATSIIGVMMFGQVVERTMETDPHTANIATSTAWMLLLGVLCIILRTFCSTVEGSDGIPSVLYGVITFLFLFYISFGLVQICHMRKVGNFKKYENVEKTYIALSFVSKAMLTLLIGSGMIIRANVKV